MNPLVLKAGDSLIPFSSVEELDISALESEHIRIITKDAVYDAFGFDAIEAILAVKPSALEGRRLRWRKGAWAFHNLAGHVGLQLLVWLGMKRHAIRWHDYTTPTMRDYRGPRV